MNLRDSVKKSFIKSITALIIFFNIVLIVLFVIMTFYMIRGNIERNAQMIVSNAVSACKGSYESFLSKSALSLQLFSSDKAVSDFFEDDTQTADAAREVRDVVNAVPEFDNVWLMSPNGVCIDKGGLCDIRNTGLMSISVRYERTVAIGSHYDSEYGIIIYRPYVVNNEQAGVIYAQISPEVLGSHIGSAVSAMGTYPVLFSEMGTPIYAPPAVMKMLKNTGEDISYLNSGQAGKMSYLGNGTSHGCFMSERLSSGWLLTVVYDGQYIEGSFRKSFSQQLIVLVCLFALELIATLNAIRYQSRDIPEISDSIAHISAGNYNFRINSTSENEIGLIAKSVDELADQLQKKNAVIDDYINLDATTGLYNRYKMYEYLQDLASVRDEARPRFALLFIDIDNFKWVTETLGHKQGDEFLRIFGSRIKETVPRVFRFSGDEFVVVTELGKDNGMINELIRNIKEKFTQPIDILNNKLYAHFSVGISIYPDDDLNLDMLLRDADIAMQRAKEKGKGRTEFFSAIFHQNVLNKSTIAQHLNKAIENNELYLVFQPIISVKNGDIHGFEALIRWESHELGFVPPSSFVAIAEETGSIEQIGTWIFENGCRTLKKMLTYNKGIVMSINVSAVQLKKDDFIDKVRRMISLYGIDPANLQVEITESLFVDMVDDRSNMKKLQALADMGIAIALDDFGTGYSSFSYLKNMPVRTLKVDKSFVDEIGSKSKDYQITNSIIGMVHSLGIKTVVEGVESIEQYNILTEFGCDYIQGFLMSKPLKERAALDFVIEYEEFHKPNEQILIQNSDMLAEERRRKENGNVHS